MIWLLAYVITGGWKYIWAKCGHFTSLFIWLTLHCNTGKEINNVFACTKIRWALVNPFSPTELTFESWPGFSLVPAVIRLHISVQTPLHTEPIHTTYGSLLIFETGFGWKSSIVSGESTIAVRSHLLVMVFQQCPSSASHNVVHWLQRENNVLRFPYGLMTK